jgi:hypothetical protein
MLDTLDEGLQWLFLLKVYGEEVWVLPLTAAVIILTKGRTWAIPARAVLLLALLVYVVIFRMHWHSSLAIPILALVIASDVVRDRWYRLLGGLRTALMDARARSAGARRQPRYWLLLLGFQLAATVLIFIYFDAPADLWALGVAAIILALLCGLIPGWRRLAETRFKRELRRDPRLGRYLDWVRWTRARTPRDRQSILSQNWIARDPNHPEPSGIRLRLARLVLRKRRMMTIGSAFVIQNLRRERELAWQALQDVLHEGSADSSHPASPPPAPISAILASEHGHAALIEWLAMTEALAECMAFVDDRPDEKAGERPRWLMASELLAHAGEVEHEIVLDLKREARASGAAATSDLGRQVTEHRGRASQYFDLAACCIENHLEPGSGVPEASLDARWRRVIGNRTAWWRPQPMQDPAVAEEALWRTVLALRYQLLDTLSPQKSEVPKVRHVASLFRGDIGNEPSTRLYAAALARDAAESSLWASARHGDPGSRWALDDRRVWADRLRQLDYWQARLRPGAAAGDDDCVMAAGVLRRVVHLWGLAIEQDLEVLRRGTDIWRDRLESAADFYIYEGSTRVRRLAALSRAPPVFEQAVEMV